MVYLSGQCVNLIMDTRRKIFNVDWDSPSTETGTVKRRPLSMNVNLKNIPKLSRIRPKSSVFGSKPLNNDLVTKTAINHRHETRVSKLAVKKEFGLKLSGTFNKSRRKETHGDNWKESQDGRKVRQSGIPKPKITSSNTRARLVNSSSESSGIGSPLSPLSPQNDADRPETSVGGDRDVIKTSGSKSSGLGSPNSPDSPLSPDSQQYAAFYLIQQQLEKLHNCSCERRQAEVLNYGRINQ